MRAAPRVSLRRAPSKRHPSTSVLHTHLPRSASIPSRPLRIWAHSSFSTRTMATVTSKYSIREGEEKDVPQLLAMIKELAEYQGAADKVVATEETLRKTLTFSSSSAAGQGFARTLLVYPSVPDAIEGGKILPTHRKFQPPGRAVPPADQADNTDQDTGPTMTPKPAGMAIYFTTYGTWSAQPGVYVEDLYVREEYRGHGYGKALLSALAREVQARGGRKLDWSVMTTNAKSIAFYESPAIGARHVADWKVYRVDGDRLEKLAEAK